MVIWMSNRRVCYRGLVLNNNSACHGAMANVYAGKPGLFCVTGLQRGIDGESPCAYLFRQTLVGQLP